MTTLTKTPNVDFIDTLDLTRPTTYLTDEELTEELMTTAFIALEVDISFVPVGRDKRPVMSLLPTKWDATLQKNVPTWDPYRKRLPTGEETFKWFSLESIKRRGVTGIALIGGKVSGNLQLIDFDRLGHNDFETWWRAIGGTKQTAGNPVPGISNMPIDRTGKGVRGLVRLSNDLEATNEKLAKYTTGELDKNGNPKIFVIAELKGEGGQATIAPSRYADTKNHYEALNGSLAVIPTVNAKDWEFMKECAKSLDELPIKIKPAPPKPTPITISPVRTDNGIPQKLINRVGAKCNAFLNACKHSLWGDTWEEWSGQAAYAKALDESLHTTVFWQEFERGSRTHSTYGNEHRTDAMGRHMGHKARWDEEAINGRLAGLKPNFNLEWEGLPLTWNETKKRAELPEEDWHKLPNRENDFKEEEKDRGIWYRRKP